MRDCRRSYQFSALHPHLRIECTVGAEAVFNTQVCLRRAFDFTVCAAKTLLLVYAHGLYRVE